MDPPYKRQHIPKQHLVDYFKVPFLLLFLSHFLHQLHRRTQGQVHLKVKGDA